MPQVLQVPAPTAVLLPRTQAFNRPIAESCGGLPVHSALGMGDLPDTVYRALRAMARRRFATPGGGHTLQPTALVNEAWLKLRPHFETAEPSPQFYRTAAEAMRQILIDHARRKKRIKRGGDARRDGGDVAEVADSGPAGDGREFDEVLRLNDALGRLEKLDPQAAEVVKLRVFAGLTVEQAAASMGIGERTVKRDWQFARAWLAKELSPPA